MLTIASSRRIEALSRTVSVGNLTTAVFWLWSGLDVGAKGNEGDYNHKDDHKDDLKDDHKDGLEHG